jgi:hypothetical protein
VAFKITINKKYKSAARNPPTATALEKKIWLRKFTSMGVVAADLGGGGPREETAGAASEVGGEGEREDRGLRPDRATVVSSNGVASNALRPKRESREPAISFTCAPLKNPSLILHIMCT